MVAPRAVRMPMGHLFSRGVPNVAHRDREVERLAREAALVVHFDPHERTVINLGPEPVVLGSGQEVHLYLPKERGFPDVTALVTFKDGVVEMDDKLTGKKHTLLGGNKLEIGTLMIEIQTDAQAPP